MHRIFAGLAAWTVLVFIAEFAIGMAVTVVARSKGAEWAQGLFTWHMLGGVFLGTLVCIIHIMTMFHFIGSGKELKEAGEVLGEANEMAARVRKFKVQTSGIATLAPVVTGAAVILGGMAHMRPGLGLGWIHWVVGLLALAVNLVAFHVEYRALKANLDLIQEVDRKLRRDVAPALFGGPRP
ncbi:MAG TPA: hypothetical protein VJU16_06235 [Planctomycetota bacterium]|nr:hypothetical protein [Planctomycetota bacterium]